jgi:hypothetical protein
MADLLFLGHAWPTRVSPVAAATKLLGNQPSIPAQQGVWGDDYGSFSQVLPPEYVSQGSEAMAVHIGEAEAATELRFQHTVLLVQVGDDVILGMLDPAGKHDEEQMQEQRERRLQQLKSPAHASWFLAAYGPIAVQFRP